MIAQIYPHGSTDTLPFATMGSGSLAAMAVFESKYHEGLTVSCHTLVWQFLELALICLKTEATCVFLQVSIEDTYNTDSMYLSPSE